MKNNKIMIINSMKEELTPKDKQEIQEIQIILRNQINIIRWIRTVRVKIRSQAKRNQTNINL